MPAGQLILPLLSAAFPEEANDNPAAGAHVFTPDMALDSFNANHKTAYQSIDEAKSSGLKGADTLQDTPVYISPTGDDVTKYVKSPDDILPMKKPGFFHRFLNPSGSADATSRNLSFTENPELSTQENATQNMIGRSNAALGESTLANGLGKNPTADFIASGRNPSSSSLYNTAQNSSDYNSSLIPSTTAAKLSAARAEQTGGDAATMENTRLIANAPLFDTKMTLGLDDDISNLRDVNPLIRRFSRSKLTGDIDAQPAINAAKGNEANVAAATSGQEQADIPLSLEQMHNQDLIRSYMSRFGEPAPGIASRVNPDRSVSPFERTANIPMTVDQMKMQMMNKSMADSPSLDNAKTVTLKSGRTVRVPMTPPVGQDAIQQNTSQEYTTDEQGNVYLNGKLVGKMKGNNK